MSKNSIIYIRLGKKDQLLKDWFEKAAEAEINRSAIVMLVLRYYMLHGQYISIGKINLDPENLITEPVIKKIYTSEEFQDVADWLNSIGTKSSSYIKKILKECLKTDSSTELYDDVKLRYMINNVQPSPAPNAKAPINYNDEKDKLIATTASNTNNTFPDKPTQTVNQAKKKSVIGALLPANSGFGAR